MSNECVNPRLHCDCPECVERRASMPPLNMMDALRKSLADDAKLRERTRRQPRRSQRRRHGNDARTQGGFRMMGIAPTSAKLGDTVVDMCGSGTRDGVVVGVDTQAPGILVRWGDGPMDVYSVDSPVWSLFMIERETPEQPGTERYAIEVPPGFEPVRDADGRATGIAPVLTLPWGNDNGA